MREHRTRNLEIPDLVLTHQSGMTPARQITGFHGAGTTR
jgi:hypothetical protein